MRFGPSIGAGVIALAIAVSGCVGRDQRLLDDAQRLWLGEHYEESASKLLLLVDEYSDSKLVPRALLRLGEIYYLNLDDPDKSAAYFLRLAESKDDGGLGLQARNYLADIYENSKRNYDLAIEQYQTILSEYSDKINENDYRYKVARAYFRKQNYAQAIIEYQALLERNPNEDLRLDALYQIATCKFISGKTGEALEIFKGLLAKYPKSRYDYDIRLGIGSCYEEQEKLPDALLEYQKMLKLYPDKALIERKIDSVQKRMDKKLSP